MYTRLLNLSGEMPVANKEIDNVCDYGKYDMRTMFLKRCRRI